MPIDCREFEKFSVPQAKLSIFVFKHYQYPNSVKELFCQKPPEGKQREALVENFLAKQRIAADGCKPMKVIKGIKVS